MSKAERTRQMIIEQAAPLFNEKGIAGTSIDDVLKAAKVAKGCLYGHFESKEELSYASVDYMLKKLADRQDAAMQKEPTAKGKLYAFMDTYQNSLNPMFDGGCPILNFSTESDDTNPIIKQKIQTVIGGATTSFANIIRDGIQAGEFSDQLDPETFALKMFAAIEGVTMICRTMNSNAYMLTIIKSLKSELDSYSTP